VLVFLVAFPVVLTVLLRPSSSSDRVMASEPQLPITAAFFYSWYPSHWTEEGVFPYTKFTPSLGYYDSTEPALVRQQLDLAERAHLDAFISSWWGPGEVTDTGTQEILGVTEESGSTIRWSIYYEAEGYSDPTPGKIASDLSYMSQQLFSSPSYLRVDDKPVVFVYGQGGDGCSMVNRWLQAESAAGIDLYLNMKVFEGYAGCPSQPESWHQYSPTSGFEYQPPYSVTISPGFSKFGQPTVLPRNLAAFATSVEWMSLASVDWKLVSTWNEWLEGTAIEPAAEYGESYIVILCNSLPGVAPCGESPVTSTTPPPSLPQVTPSPSISAPTPTPTATPSPGATDGATPGLPPPAAPTSTTPGQERRTLLGDINCDLQIDGADAVGILIRFALDSGDACQAPTSGSYEDGYDVDCDSVVGPGDALAILLHVANAGGQRDGDCPPIGSEID
jgi:hypothetical protein